MNSLKITFIAVMFCADGMVFAQEEISCPTQPTAMSESDKKIVDVGVGKLKGLGLVDLRVQLEKQKNDTFSKIKNGDNLFKEQMFFSSYCSVIKSDKKISNERKAELIQGYSEIVRKSEQKNKNIQKQPKSTPVVPAEKASQIAPKELNLVIRIERDFKSDITFMKDNSGNKAIVKFDAFLSNTGNSQFSIIDWHAWEQTPTDAQPSAGRMFQPKLVQSQNLSHPFEFPVDLPAGSTKKLSILAPYDIPREVWEILRERVVESKTYDYSEIDRFLRDTNYSAFGQLKINNIQHLSAPVPGMQVVSYGSSEYFQCFAIEFTLANNQRVGAQFQLNIAGHPQQLVSYTPPQECKNSNRGNILQ